MTVRRACMVGLSLGLFGVGACASGTPTTDPTITEDPEYVRCYDEATGLRAGQPIQVLPTVVIPAGPCRRGTEAGRLATGCVPNDDIIFEPRIGTPEYAAYVDCLAQSKPAR